MKIIVTDQVYDQFPNLLIGNLDVKVESNIKKHEKLELIKRSLETFIKDKFPETKNDEIIKPYTNYFQKWGMTYPIIYQIKTIKKGGRLPNISALVDAMFISELRSRLLTSGHNTDEIDGGLVFDIAHENMFYTTMNGKQRELKENDLYLRDNTGILSTMLYGPTKRTAISNSTKNASYIAWCPFADVEEIVDIHLKDIAYNLKTVFPNIIPQYWITTKSK